MKLPNTHGGRKRPGPGGDECQGRGTHSRQALRERELAVLSAASALPAGSRTPTAAVSALLRQGFEIPYSSLADILRRLERRGLLRLERKRG